MLSTRVPQHSLHIGLLTIAFLLAFAPLPSRTVDPVERFFWVDARQFSFNPAVLAVNPGDPVTIFLTSTDVVHGLYIDGYDLSVESDPSQTQTLTFIADREGVFRIRCSVTCGDMHPFMIGKLRVGPNTLFQRGVGFTLLATLALLVLPAQKTNR